MLPTGKVLFFSEFELGDDAPHVWDPVTDQLQPLPPPGYNIFCGGHSFLADGRLLIAGGHLDNDRGLPDAIIFDPFTQRWTRLPDMAGGRWYPTNTTLPNGEVLVVSGAREDQVMNPIPEIWSPETGAWRRLTGASRSLDYYPWMFVVPDGRVFMAGPTAQTAWLDPNGSGTWVNGPRTRYGDKRSYGSAVLYDVGKIFIVGGDDPPTNSAEVIDLNQPSPTWRMVPPMSVIRRQHNATLLPDGSVLVTGGHSGQGNDDPSQPRRETELWDPRTETWTRLAPIDAYRGYHSVAVLLPDGRVLSAGGRKVSTMQVFSPPYLFKGERPVLLNAPDTLNPGQAFTVFTPQAATIAQVTLIRLASVTHAFDENQRILRMDFREEAGNLIVTAPTNARLAPPGHYMMFLVDGRGVPSVAKIVRLGGSTAPPPPPPPLATQVAIPFGSTWKYNDRNVDPGTAWTSPGFDDSGWPSGPAQLGYGEKDEKTVLRKTTPVQPSVYFRRKLRMEGTVQAANLKVLFDDGIAVWVNGTLVFSRNITNTAHSAHASGSSGDNGRAEASIPPTAFVNGENTIAVMVKQINPTSSDLSFDLELSLSGSRDRPHLASLMLERPNGGESFHVGVTERIRWVNHGDTSGTVDLEYSTDGGSTWKPIARGVADTGGFDWVVPAENTERALVRIFPSGMPDAADRSEAPFSLSTSATFVAVPFREVWRYNDRNVDPGPTWMNAAFDDSSWRHGPGQLGYGDEDERTVLNPTSPVQPSLYFRKKFSLPAKPSAARVRVLFDDGFVLWVNGRRVTSRNVGGLAHTAFATGDGENTVAEVDIDASAFVAGENTLAVMVKQRGPTSSDVSFDLELRVTTP
jgi:hypothetical protein